MKKTDDRDEAIHRLWDELADFDAASGDAAIMHLLASLCELVDAQNANWFGAVRLADILPGDPVHGWRTSAIHYLYPSQPVSNRARELVRKLERGNVDETAIRNVALAGTYRANRLVDIASAAWFESDYYLTYYKGLGHVDVIWAGVPINEDAECYFGLFRDGEHPRFSAAERDAVACALRSLKWFLRQQLLAHGLLVASAPLTPTERGVLQGMLTGQPEKQIAAELGHSYHTTHEYITSIFRKFGVNNRAALMSLWLGQSA